MANIATLSNVSIAPDTDETCTINVTSLASKISGLGDSYFADSANWSSIQVEYRSSTGKQREVVSIDPSSPTGTFKVSLKARSEAWVIHEIRVRDFDGDFYAVKKADMIAADYDEPTITGPGTPVILQQATGSGSTINTQTTYVEQSFSHSAAVSAVTSVDIDMKVNNAFGGGTIDVKIYSGAGGTGTLIATSDPIDATSGGLTGGATMTTYTFDFPSSLGLSASTTYYIYIDMASSGFGGPGSLDINADFSDFGYSNGTANKGGVAQSKDIKFTLRGIEA